MTTPLADPLRTDDIFLASTRLRQSEQTDWLRLDDIVTALEKRRIRRVREEDLLDLPVLYRSALSSLSVARQSSLDRSLTDYLEQLCTRAYFQIYGVKQSAWRQLAHFFVHDWPAAVRGIWRETAVSLAITLLGALLGYQLVMGDPGWYYAILPESLAAGRDPAASEAFLREGLYDTDHGNLLATFAAQLFTHNSQIALLAFALGFALCVPTAMLLVSNGALLGAIYAVYLPKGLGVEFTGWLLIHGTTELFAIILAGAAGFRIGLALAFPGAVPRMEAAVAAGRQAGAVMIGVVIMLLVAGLLEGIGRQTIVIDWQRYAIAGGMLTFWLVYFYLPRVRR